MLWTVGVAEGVYGACFRFCRLNAEMLLYRPISDMSNRIIRYIRSSEAAKTNESRTPYARQTPAPVWRAVRQRGIGGYPGFGGAAISLFLSGGKDFVL